MKKNPKKKLKKKNLVKTESKFLKIKKKLFNLTNTFKKKTILIGFLIILVFLFIYLIVNFAFLFNFLIGYDTVIKLSSSEQSFTLKNEESGRVDFSMYVSTNVFCESICFYKFVDLSNSELIDEGNFSKKIANPFKKSYELFAPSLGEGLKLYNFELVCFTENKGLCKSDSEIKRNKLIPLSYELNSTWEKFRNVSRENIEIAMEEYNKIKYLKNRIFVIASKLNQSLIINNDLVYDFDNLEKSLENKIYDFKNYKYDINSQEILLQELGNLSNILLELNSDLNLTMNKFNEFLIDLDKTRDKLLKMKIEGGYTLEDSNLINQKIIKYNSLILETKEVFYLDDLKLNLTNLILELDNFEKSNFGVNYTFNEVLKSNLTMININDSFENDYFVDLGKGEELCCYLGKCEKCCDESCFDDPSKYPVLLLHGHSFNEKVSAEKSLSDMGKIQDALVLDGFLNGGQITIGNKKEGRFSQTNQQIVFVGSYYFDVYENKEGKIIFQTKSDDINTYAIRLNDLVNIIKEETGRDKIIIVSHSMGGLVSRRYLQIYGDNSVSELIMIGTPNKGIDGTILKSCSVFGANSNCEDMDKESLLMNKLIYGPRPKIPVSTIIGQGCRTEGVDSDGIVKVDSSYLEWADNYYVNGTCSGVDFFHITMRDPGKYPEVYEIVKGLIFDEIHA